MAIEMKIPGELPREAPAFTHLLFERARRLQEELRASPFWAKALRADAWTKALIERCGGDIQAALRAEGRAQ
jgi:hypothetical protein